MWYCAVHTRYRQERCSRHSVTQVYGKLGCVTVLRVTSCTVNLCMIRVFCQMLSSIHLGVLSLHITNYNNIRAGFRGGHKARPQASHQQTASIPPGRMALLSAGAASPPGPQYRHFHPPPLGAHIMVFWRASPIELWGPMFNIQEKITLHFHTQCALCTRVRVSIICWNEKFKY